jgi:microcystin-dependent protein
MAGFASGTLNTENVDLDSSQTVSNKTLDASNDYSGDIIDPSRSDVKQGTQAELEAYASGASNGQMCFATDTKQMYQVLDGALAAVGGGSGGLDVFFTDTFEVAGVSDYTSGNDAIFDNGGVLAGALADETVNNISGDQSLKYTQAAGSLNSGNSDDIKIVGYDDTGSEVMTLSSNLIKASSKAQRLSVQFPVPSSSANLAWGIQVVVENIGAVLVVDDVQISTNPYVSKDMDSGPVGEIIALGLDTAPKNFVYCDGTAVSRSTYAELFSKVGTNYGNGDGSTTFNLPDFRGQFLRGQDDGTGTDPDAALRTSTNGGNTGDNVGSEQSDELGSHNHQYTWGANSAGGAVGMNQLYNFLGSANNIAAQTTASRGGDETRPTNISVRYYIRYNSGQEHIVAYNSRNAENSMVRLHTGNGHGSVNNKIRRFSTTVADLGNAITYADSATDGASFTINEDGVYMVSYTDTYTGGAVRFGLSLNSTQLTTSVNSISSDDILTLALGAASNLESSCAWSGALNKDDVIRTHTDGNPNTTDGRCQFTISKIGVGDLLGTPVPRTAYIKDVKPNGTSGGTFTSGAWQTRDLNTLEGDTEFVSLSANQIILAPGKYEIEASAPSFRVDQNMCKLYNITDSTDDILGSASYTVSSSNSFDTAMLTGTIIITESKTFEIQHRATTTRATNGFGTSPTFGVDVVFTQVKIKKVS